MAEHRSEEQLAKELNLYQQAIYLRRRTKSVAGFIAGIIAAAICWWQSFDFVFFLATASSLLALILYFDANGHLHELRRRSTKTLVPDFSLLDKQDDAPQVTQSSAQTGP